MVLTIVAALLVAAGIALSLTLLRRARTMPPGRPEGPEDGVPAVRPAPDPHLPVVAASAGVGPQLSPVARVAPPAEEPVPISPLRVTPPVAPPARRAVKNSGSSRFSAGRPVTGPAPSWAAPRT